MSKEHSDPMESDRRSSFLFGRIFCDEPVSTSSENALERIPIRWNRIGALASCLVAFSSTNRRPLRRKMLQTKCMQFGVRNMLYAQTIGLRKMHRMSEARDAMFRLFRLYPFTHTTCRKV